MILTYKVKHHEDLREELKKAKLVAQFALKHRSRSSKDVKHIGLKSTISNQILKKYSSNKKLKQIASVKLSVPGQGVNLAGKVLKVPCLKLELPFDELVEKINQIELDSEYAYISCTIKESEPIIVRSWIGVDLNTTGHCAVASNSKTGKGLKLGKKSQHTRKKFKALRIKLQKKSKLRDLKSLKNKESRVIRDLNHKISSKLVREARKQSSGIVLEDLKGIRKSAKTSKSFRYSLNSWSYYQLGEFIKYKAKLHGVPIIKIDPRYTSQQCSRCGLLGNRNKKTFKCPHCGHVDHADVNASFVIGLRHQGVLQSILDRDNVEGVLTTPRVPAVDDSKPRTQRL